MFPPDVPINDVLSKSGVEILFEAWVGLDKRRERGLAGLAPLSVDDCPECREHDNPRNVVPGSGGR
jgi:hypothetical protein